MPRPKALEGMKYHPKSRGDCGYSKCRKPVYKNAVRYGNKTFHSRCIVQAVKDGEVQ